MIETKTLTIADKEYKMRCSLLTVETYERTTGKKFSSLISQYQKLGNGMADMSDEEATEYLMDSLVDIEKSALTLAYCMIQEGKNKGYNEGFEYSLEEFIGEVGALSSEELKGVLQLAMSVFPRKVQKRTDTDRSQGQ